MECETHEYLNCEICFLLTWRKNFKAKFDHSQSQESASSISKTNHGSEGQNDAKLEGKKTEAKSGENILKEERVKPKKLLQTCAGLNTKVSCNLTSSVTNLERDRHRDAKSEEKKTTSNKTIKKSLGKGERKRNLHPDKVKASGEPISKVSCHNPSATKYHHVNDKNISANFNHIRFPDQGFWCLFYDVENHSDAWNKLISLYHRSELPGVIRISTAKEETSPGR